MREEVNELVDESILLPAVREGRVDEDLALRSHVPTVISPHLGVMLLGGDERRNRNAQDLIPNPLNR